MIVTEVIDTREDGVNLYKTYSNMNLKIKKMPFLLMRNVIFYFASI